MERLPVISDEACAGDPTEEIDGADGGDVAADTDARYSVPWYMGDDGLCTLPIRFLLLSSALGERSLRPVSSNVLVRGRTLLCASLVAVKPGACRPLLLLLLRLSIPTGRVPFRLLGGLICPLRASRSNSFSLTMRLLLLGGLLVGRDAAPPVIVVVVPSAICPPAI